MRLVLVAALALSLAACSTDPQGTRLGLQTDASQGTRGDCPHALAAPFRIVRDGTEMTFVDVGTGAPVSVVWPFGFAAWVEDGVAVLYASDGSIVGRDGAVLDNIGGGATGDGGFNVCAVGVRFYT